MPAKTVLPSGALVTFAWNVQLRPGPDLDPGGPVVGVASPGDLGVALALARVTFTEDLVVLVITPGSGAGWVGSVALVLVQEAA